MEEDEEDPRFRGEEDFDGGVAAALMRLLGQQADGFNLVRPATFAARHIGCAESELARAEAMVSTVQVTAASLLLGQVLKLDRDAPVAGPSAGVAPAWAPAAHGWPRRPLQATVGLPAGALAPPPLAVRIFKGMTENFVEVMCHTTDMDSAASALRRLAGARGTANPLHGAPYETIWAPGVGLSLRPIPAASVRATELQLSAPIRDAISTNVDGFFDTAERWGGANLGLRRGVLLVGPPGSGKTALCREIAHRMRDRCTVLLPTASSLHGGVVRHLYREAERLAPTIVVLDDFDRLCTSRFGDDIRETLSALDGFEQSTGAVLTLATANDAGVFDEAMLRAARFDVTVEIDLPDAALRRRILDAYVAPAGVELDLDPVIARTDGASGADLRELVRAALLNSGGELTTDALVEALKGGRWRPSGATGFYL